MHACQHLKILFEHQYPPRHNSPGIPTWPCSMQPPACAPVANDVEYIIEAVYSVDPNESLIVNCTCLVSELIQSQLRLLVF